MHHPQYKSIRAAYSFYNVATSVTLKELVSDALILARNVRFLLNYLLLLIIKLDVLSRIEKKNVFIQFIVSVMEKN